MTQPLDRTCSIPAQGKIDKQAGEFWVNNPFEMLTKGHNLSAYERNKLYLSLEGQSFLDASFASTADIPSDSRSAITADFTGDGAPDLLVASVGGGPLRLFRNRYPQKNRVRIELIGTDSNRSAIGTRLIAKCGARTIVRDVFSANGFMGQGPVETLIGIGEAAHIDRLTVRWPTGRTQHFDRIPAGAHIVLRERDDNYTTGNLKIERSARP